MVCRAATSGSMESTSTVNCERNSDSNDASGKDMVVRIIQSGEIISHIWYLKRDPDPVKRVRYNTGAAASACNAWKSRHAIAVT